MDFVCISKLQMLKAECMIYLKYVTISVQDPIYTDSAARRPILCVDS